MEKILKKLRMLIVLTFISTMSTSAQKFHTSNETGKKEIELATFHSIQVSGLAKVYIAQDVQAKEEAIMIVSGMPMDEVSLNVENGILRINTPSNYSGESVEIYITYKNLNSIKVGGAAELISQNTIVSSLLDVELTGVANAILEVDVDTLKIATTCSSDLTIRGFAKIKKILSESRSSTLRQSNLCIDQG